MVAVGCVFHNQIPFLFLTKKKSDWERSFSLLNFFVIIKQRSDLVKSVGGTMKREDLKKINGMTDEMIQAVMDLHQVDANDWQSKKQSWIQKESELNEKLEKYNGVDVDDLKKQISDLQKKYNDDLLKKDVDYAKADLFKGYKFSSSYAKKAIEKEFDEKALKFENGSFIGADEFFKTAQANDPGAFIIEDNSGSDGETKPDTSATTGASTGVSLKNTGKPKDITGIEKIFYEMNPDLAPSKK